MGTPNVESLTSYISRLAEAHSVSLRTLAIQELLPLLKRDYLSNPLWRCLSSFWKEQRAHSMELASWPRLGAGIGAFDSPHRFAVSDFSALGCRAHPQRQMRFTRAWCPDCLIEWQAAGNLYTNHYFGM